MKLLLSTLLNVGGFVISLLVLQIVWVNTREAWKEKDWKNILFWPFCALIFFLLLTRLCDVVNAYIGR